jgi:hypothetical protein
MSSMLVVVSLALAVIALLAWASFVLRRKSSKEAAECQREVKELILAHRRLRFQHDALIAEYEFAKTTISEGGR